LRCNGICGALRGDQSGAVFEPADGPDAEALALGGVIAETVGDKEIGAASTSAEGGK